LETKTCFRFHQSLVNSEKMIPPNWGWQICPRRADLPVGKKRQIPLYWGLCYPCFG
jgi:hypothetical protein